MTIRDIPGIAKLRYYPQDKVLVIEYEEHVVVNEFVLNKVMDASLQLTDNQKFVLVLDTSKIMYVTREARELSSKKNIEYIIAMATVVKNKVQREIYNLFVRFSKPPYPVKAFDNLEQALKWAKEEARKFKG